MSGSRLIWIFLCFFMVGIFWAKNPWPPSKWEVRDYADLCGDLHFYYPWSHMFTLQMVINLEIFPSYPQKGFVYLRKIRSFSSWGEEVSNASCPTEALRFIISEFLYCEANSHFTCTVGIWILLCPPLGKLGNVELSLRFYASR